MKKLLSCAALAMLLPSGAGAHHGTSGQFDATKIIEISGTITKMAFVNPHSYVYFDAVMGDGSVENWNCELRASSLLRRSGWSRDMFEAGTKIDIVGVAARKDPQGCYIETIAFNGSAPIGRYDAINEESLKPLGTDRPSLTPWGAPNLAGDWATNQHNHGTITRADARKIDPDALETLIAQNKTEQGDSRGRPNDYVGYSAAGKAYAKAQTALAADDRVTGRLDCTPRDFFSDWTFDQPTNQIVQTEDTITLKYGFMDSVRTVHLRDDFPEEITPSWTGYSIGRWEGNTLVVSTKGFTIGGSSRRGFHSEAMSSTERFVYDARTPSITREYVGRDPKFWTENFARTGRDTVYLSEVPWEPYNCDDRAVE